MNIENILDRVGVSLSKMTLDLASSDQLLEAIQDVLKRLHGDSAITESSYGSLPQRLETIIAVAYRVV